MNGLAPVAGERDRPSPRKPAECPVENWMVFLGHRWNALILWHLNGETKRHGELAALLPGITPKVLTERLDGLEQRGLVVRTPIATFPRGVSYTISPCGVELIAILDQVEVWARRNEITPREQGRRRE